MNDSDAPQLERRLGALTRLMQGALALAEAERPEQLRALSAVAAQGMGVDRVGIWYLEGDPPGIRCVYLHEVSGESRTEEIFLPEEAAPAYFAALRENRLLVADDARTDPRTREFTAAYLDPLGIHSMLDAPIFVDGRLVGVVCFEAVGEPRNWSADEQLFALAVANLAALAEVQRDRAVTEEALRQSRKMDSLGRLAGGIAHDFNNALTAILGVADLLLMDREADDPLRRDVEEIVRSTERLAALTRQLQAFTRQQFLRPRPVQLNELLVDMERFFARVLGEGIAVEFQRAPALPPVVADPGQMERVLMHLAENARDAMPDGGTLILSTRREGDQVVLAVADTGVGMSREVRERAFEPFFTTREQGDGAGLGLANVYGTILQSGGSVELDSKPGAGTTVTIRLPVGSTEAWQGGSEVSPSRRTPGRTSRRPPG